MLNSHWDNCWSDVAWCVMQLMSLLVAWKICVWISSPDLSHCLSALHQPYVWSNRSEPQGRRSGEDLRPCIWWLRLVGQGGAAEGCGVGFEGCWELRSLAGRSCLKVSVSTAAMLLSSIYTGGCEVGEMQLTHVSDQTQQREVRCHGSKVGVWSEPGQGWDLSGEWERPLTSAEHGHQAMQTCWQRGVSGHINMNVEISDYHMWCAATIQWCKC